MATVEENYKRLRDELNKRLEANKQLAAIADKIAKGKADFNDTSKYSHIVSQIMGDVISENIGSINVPLGKEFVCKELLREHYDRINGVLGEVQASVDDKLGIHLNPKKAPFPTERVDKAAHSLEDPTVPIDTIERRAKSVTENIAESMHDDYIKENASWREQAGLDCYLVRDAGGGCCSWCQALEGRYPYATAPDDVFRRHDNCHCSVTYECGKKRQDVWSKRTWEEPEDKLAARKELEEQSRAKVLTREQTIKIESKALDSGGMNYRAIVRSENAINTERDGIVITLRRAETAVNDIYISDNVVLKPKLFHEIDKKITDVYKMMNISNSENTPVVYLISDVEMSNKRIVPASYNGSDNILFINSKYAIYSKSNAPEELKSLACYTDDRSTIIHELYHWKDAEEYRNKYGTISEGNLSEYNKYVESKCKKGIDKLIKNGYNILEISNYATENLMNNKFTEPFTEFRTKRLLEEGLL